jgi:SAM-dependent methyltransferase
VAAGYQQAAASYDREHGDRRSRARFAVIERPMLAVVEDAERVLEIGCGTGRLLSQVRAPVRIGIDVAPAMLYRARTRIAQLAVADAHALPFARESFDAIIAGKGVFRYLDPGRAFAECSRVLARGGRLALHHYAARTWSWRSLRRTGRGRAAPGEGTPGETSIDIEDLNELYAPAARAGLRLRATRLWRPVRIPPYAVPVPTWLPGRWWSHCVLLFDR